MTVQVRPIISRQYVPNANALMFTSTGVKTVIDKATVTNTSASAVQLDAYINTPGGTGVTSQVHFLYGKTIAVDECYLLPELTGRIVDVGSGVNMTASAANALCLALSGRQIS